MGSHQDTSTHQHPAQAANTRAAFCCPTQVLVIDQPDGPADLLMDSAARLLARHIAITLLDDRADVTQAFARFRPDLVVLGLAEGKPEDLLLLAKLRTQYAGLPVIVVGRRLSRQYRTYARQSGADDIIEMPCRAAELKAVIRHIEEVYFPG